MLQVNLEDVKKVYEQRQLWNKTPLKDIEFLWQGQVVSSNPTMIEDGIEVVLTLDKWLYTGLNKFDYMLMLLMNQSLVADVNLHLELLTLLDNLIM